MTYAFCVCVRVICLSVIDRCMSLYQTLQLISKSKNDIEHRMAARKQICNVWIKISEDLKWWCASVCIGLIHGWLSFILQITFSASRKQTWAKTINTIKAVHLSTVPDRAAHQGGIMKSFPSEADETHWQNKSMKYKDVIPFPLSLPSFLTSMTI